MATKNLVIEIDLAELITSNTRKMLANPEIASHGISFVQIFNNIYAIIRSNSTIYIQRMSDYTRYIDTYDNSKPDYCSLGRVSIESINKLDITSRTKQVKVSFNLDKSYTIKTQDKSASGSYNLVEPSIIGIANSLIIRDEYNQFREDVDIIVNYQSFLNKLKDLNQLHKGGQVAICKVGYKVFILPIEWDKDKTYLRVNNCDLSEYSVETYPPAKYDQKETDSVYSAIKIDTLLDGIKALKLSETDSIKLEIFKPQEDYMTSLSGIGFMVKRVDESKPSSIKHIHYSHRKIFYQLNIAGNIIYDSEVAASLIQISYI